MPTSRRTTVRPRRKGVWVWATLGVFVVSAALFALILTAWVKRYIRSDAFRAFLSRKVSEKLVVDGEFDPFVWNGSSVYSEQFQARGVPGGAISRLSGHGIRANVDFASFRREAWEVEDLTINRLELVAGPSGGETMNFGMGDFGSVALPPMSRKKSLWSRFVPNKVKITGITVAESELVVRLAEAASLESAGSRFRLSPLSGGQEDGWSFVGEGGAVRLGESPVLEMKALHGRFRDRTLYLTDSTFDLYESASLSVNGEVRFAHGEIDIKSHIRDVRGEDVLRPDWRQRLLGSIHGDFEIKGGYRKTGKLRQTGRLWMKDAVLLALPVLDGIADYTRTERFRRLPLSLASTEFERLPGRIEFRKLRLYSDGLMRVEGGLTVEDRVEPGASRPISGAFQVGVVRSVLKWLPGAESKVFTTERDGYVWTTMRVAGTLEAPEEDLTPRLRDAVIAVAAELPSQAIGVGTGLLDEAAGILERRIPSGPAKDAAGALLDTAEGLVKTGVDFVPMLGPKSER